MRTKELRSDLAVMNAFRQIEAKPHALVPVSLLESFWPDYGLRMEDLHESLPRMRRHGHIVLGVAGGQHVAALTRAGRRWADSQPAVLEYALVVQRRLQVQAQARSIVHRPATARSRRYDLPLGSLAFT